jgi:C-terminal processing protease CtpA/Prc
MAFSQTETIKFPNNLNLEHVNPVINNFDGLIKWGTGYGIAVDSTEKHSGKYSMRIEPLSGSIENQFGCGVFRIPANFEGKNIELRGYMKLDSVTKGYAGLFMRIDGETGMNQIDNMLNRNINGTRDWALYSLELPLSADDKYIYFGAILSGTGKLWADDFQILIDGKDITEAKSKDAIVYKAMLDTTFNFGSGLELNNLTDNDYHNLTILGKLWGFLKYYNPSVAKGDINWDYELFRILPKIINSPSKENRNKVLLEWIKSLGAISEKQAPMNIEKNKIKFMPDLDWIGDESEFGNDISAALKEIKDAKRNSKNYYLSFIAGVNNPVFSHESAYNNMPYPDAGYRLLSLYRYWNIIEYVYPYKNLLKDDWNRVLTEFIPDFIKCENELNYRLTLLKLIGRINDTHANIWGNDTVLFNYFGKYAAPCRISFIENLAVVTELYPAADTAIIFKRGDIIKNVNGLSIEEIVNMKLPIYPASNLPARLRNISNDILRGNSDIISVTFERNGQIQKDSIKCIELQKLYKYMFADNKRSWEILDSSVGYIYPGTIKNSELPEMMKAFNNCKGIIIDLRSYPSDFIVFSLSNYLMPSPVPFVKFSNTNLNMPGLFQFSDTLSAGLNNPDYYKGKVVIIVNETTQSSAEYHTLAFRKAPYATVIGSTTAGADGNVSQFYLPGGISTMISGIGVYYPDGTETQQVGIIPDIEVKPTIKGIIDGKDELLDKAVQIINESK